MRQIILADQYNTSDVIEEEKNAWVRLVLSFLEVPEHEIYVGNKDVLIKYDLQVWDDLEHGDVEIMKGNELVGKWYMPELYAKTDEHNKVYYEIHLDYDSIMDNQINFGD